MKYGDYDEIQTPLAIDSYDDGAHIIVLRAINNFISTSIKLEDEGWELRDSIKVIAEIDSFNATLFRKPFVGTVANNVLENGCGGINIDACRLKGGGGGTNCNNRNDNGECMGHDNNDSLGGGMMRHGPNTQPKGRFPANLILIHSNCRPVGNVKIKGSFRKPTGKPLFDDTGDSDKSVQWNANNVKDTTVRGYGDEVVAVWECHALCPVKKLDKQSGSVGGNSGGSYKNKSLFFEENDAPKGYTDSGGASRFFYNANSQEELKEYLISLIRC